MKERPDISRPGPDRTGATGGARGEERFGRRHLRRLGGFLRAERRAAGLTMRMLAERSGVGVTTIRALESGRSSPGLSTVLALVDALGTTIDRAIEAARSGTDGVVVSRGEGSLSEGMPEPAMAGLVLTLSERSVRPIPAEGARSASMCMVLQGSVIAALGTGERVRLEAGDTYHAQPGAVQGWASSGGGAAKLLCVLAVAGKGAA